MWVTLFVDDRPVTVPRGSTLLEGAESAGAWVPTLCHLQDVAPRAGCRLCLVALNGEELVASCHREAREGDRVSTTDERVQRVRRLVMELLLGEHGSCPEGCELEELASRLGVTYSRFRGGTTRPRLEPPNEYLTYDSTRCIRCDRCVRACSRQVLRRPGDRGGAIATLGGHDQIGEPENVCVGCGDCTSACPARALIVGRPARAIIKEG